MIYDAVVVGGGIAGLTAAAFLSKAGKSVLVCEKEDKCGGLVNTFEREGFVYDGGIRAMENSGVLFPMLRQLGISIDFIPNRISMGIEDKVIYFDSEKNLLDYHKLLVSLYPENREEIDQIIEQVRRIMYYMEVQYGIDNPMFLDVKKDREYMLRKVVPWVFKYALTAPKISKINGPVVDFLKRYTNNQSLLDIIAQHFFQETPAFFALSYLKLYLDYHYPRGGTGTFIKKLEEFIFEHQGDIEKNTEILKIDYHKKYVEDSQGRIFQFRRLIWAADQHSLYNLIDPEKLSNPKSKKAVIEKRNLIRDKVGNDSIFTLFLGTNLELAYYEERCSGHFFYTPNRKGQSLCGPYPVGKDRTTIEKWLDQFFELTTYEISIPVLRDSSLAPPGKSGLVISVLFDYRLTKTIEEQGWYNAFKDFCEKNIINVLNSTIYPGLSDSIVHKFSSTPLTMANLTGNHQGAITGWSFTNRPVPAESRLPKIMNAINTNIPGIYQAGQWTYSPSGLPISFLTGKIAADRVMRDLKK